MPPGLCFAQVVSHTDMFDLAALAEVGPLLTLVGANQGNHMLAVDHEWFAAPRQDAIEVVFTATKRMDSARCAVRSHHLIADLNMFDGSHRTVEHQDRVTFDVTSRRYHHAAV